jgi:hypothetical protein
MPKIAFVDTNVYLHYQPFDQIDWREILDADTVTIVVPPIVVRELNKQKELHPRPRVRRRAAAVLKKLTTLLQSASDAELRVGTNVLIEDRDPTIDFAAHQLNHEIQDDHLIASIIMWQEENREGEVVLVTSDAGLTLLTKAKRHGITAVQLPDNLKLAEEPDPSEKQVRELQRELNELKLKTPRLLLAFDDGSDHTRFVLPRPLNLTQAELDSELEDVKQQYPKMQDGTGPISRDSFDLLESMSVHGAAAFSLGAVPREDIAKYNSELDDFYAAYVDHFKRGLSFRNLERRTVSLKILLVNDGTAPAEDIDVSMFFPDGFRLASEPPSSGGLKPPLPPSKPRTPLERLTERTLSTYDFPPSIIDRYTMGTILGPSNAPRPNVSSPEIKRLDSYEVQFNVRRIKHNMQVSCDPLFVAFDSFESARSFRIDYEILAANVPHKVAGQLHMIIERECKSGASVSE